MWWVPIAMYAKNKMDEGKAKEDARKQQIFQIQSQLAASNGAPTYGIQAAQSQYNTQRQIDAQRRASNAQLMKSVFDNASSFSEQKEDEPQQEAPPRPDDETTDPETGRSAYDDAELERSRQALRSYQ